MAGNLTAMIASIFSGSAVSTDPYFNLTTLLLPGNGTNGAQNNTFLDGSTNNFTITRNGNTTQGTFSPFSQTGWGNYFNGSSRLSLASNVALTPGSGDFTIECWIYPTAAFSTYNGIFVGDATGSMNFGKLSGGIGLRISGTSDIISATAPSINQWTHIAITRSGTDVRLFYNGVQQGSTVTNSTNFVQSATAIGDNGGGTAYWNGYISNLRFVKGTALYTSNFTPSTAPLTAISNTQLLTLQSNRFIDNSTNAFTLTPSGSPSVVAFSPFNPTASWSTATNGGSGYFDGSGDYLQIQNSNDFDTNTAFTLECWVYTNSNGCMFGRGGGGASWSTTNGHQFIFSITGGVLRWQFNSSGSPVTLDSSAIQLNSWVHCAVGYNGTTTRLWLNGVSAATSTSSYTMPTTRNIVQAGLSAGSDQPYTGYMSGLRFVKSDVYGVGNTTFTPPTAPLTAITNTSLLLNFTNAGITDATAKNDLETVGNAQISTAQSKWDGSSIAFDGTSDYLVAPSSQFWTLGSTEDFTIEFWFYTSVTVPISGSTPSTLISNYPDWNTWTNRWLIATNDNKIKWYDHTGNAAIASNNFTYSVWNHVAVVRSSNSIKMYINGTQEGSTQTTNQNYTSTEKLYVGLVPGGSAFNGYISDLRITKGYARYTANFTAPTAAFPTL